MIRLTRDSMESAFEQYTETVFALPEVISAGVRDITITRENAGDAVKRAFEAGFVGQGLPSVRRFRHAGYVHETHGQVRGQQYVCPGLVLCSGKPDVPDHLQERDAI